MALKEKHALAPHEMRTRTNTMTIGSKLKIPGFVSISFGSSIKSEPNQQAEKREEKQVQS